MDVILSRCSSCEGVIKLGGGTVLFDKGSARVQKKKTMPLSLFVHVF